MPSFRDKGGSIWTQPRKDSFEYWVIEDGEATRLTGVTGGQITYSAFTTLKASGRLSHVGEDIGWLDRSIRVYLVSEAEDGRTERVPLGTFMTTTPRITLRGGVKAFDIEMYSSLLALEQTLTEFSLSFAAGTAVTTAVGNMLQVHGFTSALIAPSSAVLAGDVTFEGGKSLLSVCNDLLARINYENLNVDGYGRVLVVPYVDPQRRPVAWTFRDDDESIFLPDVPVEEDTFDTPNVVVLVSSTPDIVLTATAVNSDPASRFSTISRGRRIVRYETVDITDQALLNDAAQRLLSTSMLSVESAHVTHSFVPIQPLDVVEFDYRQAGYTRRLSVANMDIDLSAGAITRSRFRWFTQQ